MKLISSNWLYQIKQYHKQFCFAMTKHCATSNQWKNVERWANSSEFCSTISCLLELRNRLVEVEQKMQKLEQSSSNHFDASKMVATDAELIKSWDLRNSDHLTRIRFIYNLGRQHGAAQVTCPHIIITNEGTSYCQLAEQGNSSAALTNSPAPAGALVEMVAEAIGVIRTTQATSRAAIQAVAAWFDAIGYGATASILRQEVKHD